MMNSGFGRLLRELRDDRSGNFAMLFAICSLGMLLAAGTAVDVTRAYADKTDMANALDAAVLSTSKALSVGQIGPSEAEAYMNQMFAGNMANSDESEGTFSVENVKIDNTTNTVSADATYTYEASFGIFGKAGEFPIATHSAASFGDGTAEVAMTFDLTGSMAGSKIASLRDAANRGIKVLLGANANGEQRIRIAAIPYAASVNVGPDLVKYIYPDDGKPDTVAPKYASGSGGGYISATVNSGGVSVGLGSGSGNSLNIGLGNTDAGNNGIGILIGNRQSSASGGGNGQSGSSGSQVAASPDDCATERKGPEQFSDDGPDQGMINRDGRLGEDGCPDAAIVPLTADAETLYAEVNKFAAGGTTAGHIGIQWAWYMLSHKWAAFMTDGTGAAAPSKKLHKYAIIMTDGEFNTAYAGVKTGQSVSNQAAKSISDALQLCTNMKDDGIQVFTIGFGLKQKSAIQTLQACASPNTNGMTFFYNASSGTELVGIYEEIAAMIQKLRLVS